MGIEIQNGRAVAFAMRNNGSPIQITGYTLPVLDTSKIAYKNTMDELKDETGFDLNLVWTNGFSECDFAFCPTGTTINNANADVVFLTPGAKVTVSNFAAGSEINGDWINLGDQTIDFSLKAVKMTLKLRKYKDPTQNALLTTTAS